ncbi:MAG: formylglycine-generating enzyme family protein [Candidatus Omnitrophota bacterium]|nr:MAG: formylglycine-generating enzyme family protein [Candidatus Omnitrophota bacterium]
MLNKEYIQLFVRSHVNSIGMKMRLIHPGSFMMGSENSWYDEKPAHKVTITKPFCIGIYPVTQAEYEAIMGVNPSYFYFGRTNRPVEMVSWHDAKEFCRRLSEKEGKTYRLPTEAEWEYCCRAGTTTEYYWGDRVNGRYAWYRHNSINQTHLVGEKLPNAWGLFDMSGNVWEWCTDWYDERYYSTSPETDPIGPPEGLHHVLRGGSWRSIAYDTRSANRNCSISSATHHSVGSIGFRVVMETDYDQ